MNNRFVVVHPLIIFFGGWFVWWFLFIVSPFQTDVDFYFNHVAFDYIFWNYMYFVIGVILALFIVNKKKLNSLEIDIESLKVPIFVMLVVCFVGDFLQTIDYVYKGGQARSLVGAITNYRAVDSIYPAPIAYFSLLTMKVSILPVFVILLNRKKIQVSNPFLFYFSLLIAIYPLFNLILFGKRGFMVITLAIYGLYFIFFGLWKEKKFMLRGLFIVIFLFVASYITFNARYGEGEYNVLQGIQATYSYAATVLPTNSAIADIENDINKRDDFIANLKIALINFTQYYTHGTFEFFHLYDYNYGRNSPRTYGSITLNLPYKVLTFLGLMNINDYTYEPWMIDFKDWVFDSFMGAQLKDWGDNAVYSVFIIGFVFGLTYRLAQSSVFLFPLYTICSVLVFFMPVTDVFNNGQAWHYIVLSLLFYFFISRMSETKKQKAPLSNIGL